MAVLRYDAVQTGPQLFQHSKQGHSFSTFASRAFQQRIRGKVQAPQSLHSALEPCNTLFHAPGPQSSGRIVWSGRQRTMSSMSPENVVYGIMALNGAVFIAWQQPSLRHFMTQHFTASYGGIRYGYYHTLLTSAVSHYSMGHIFSNMFTFYFFGSNLCQIIGGARLLQLYALAAVVGSGTQIAADRRAVCLGASAAVNAMVIFSVLLNPTATYLLYGIIPAPAWALGTAWICWDTYGAYKGGGNVGYASHLAGAAVGAAGFWAVTSGLW